MQASGWIALLFAIAASRVLSERAIRRLTPEQKLKLIDGFSATRTYSTLFTVILTISFFLLQAQPQINQRYLAIGFGASIAIIVVVRMTLTQRKLKLLDMPWDYRRMFFLAQIIAFAGLAWFFYKISIAGLLAWKGGFK